MAELIFYGIAQPRKTLCVAIWHEEWVIAKAVLALRLAKDFAGAAPLEVRNDISLPRQHHGAKEIGRAVRYIAQLREQARIIFCMIALLTAETGRPNARSASESLDAEARVIGQDPAFVYATDGLGLECRIGKKRVARFLDSRPIGKIIGIEDMPSGPEHLADFGSFMSIARSNDEVLHHATMIADLTGEDKEEILCTREDSGLAIAMNNMNGTKIFTMVAFFAMSLFASAVTPGWVTDLDKAKELAKKEKKNVLVQFTGSDFCPPCMMMHKEVFSQEEFTKKASEKFILVELDFPKKDKELADKNKPYAEEYKVEGFPTVILLDSEGKEFSRFFAAAHPKIDTFLAHLDKSLEYKDLD
jgi:thiol-disulfide isomerase/thioredoxin